jgi:hypothetical protein
MVANYLVQEEDGTSLFTLEEGNGSLLLEEQGSDGGSGSGSTGSGSRMRRAYARRHPDLQSE